MDNGEPVYHMVTRIPITCPPVSSYPTQTHLGVFGRGALFPFRKGKGTHLVDSLPMVDSLPLLGRVLGLMVFFI